MEGRLNGKSPSYFFYHRRKREALRDSGRERQIQRNRVSKTRSREMMRREREKYQKIFSFYLSK